MNSKIYIQILRVVLVALAIAWLTPVVVAFLPWSITENFLEGYGFTMQFDPLMKYWFVMAAMISGAVGAAFVYLLYKTDEKLGIIVFAGWFHVVLGMVLLIRGISLDAPLLIVVWDSVFCVMAGAVVLALSLHEKYKLKSDMES